MMDRTDDAAPEGKAAFHPPPPVPRVGRSRLRSLLVVGLSALGGAVVGAAGVMVGRHLAGGAVAGLPPMVVLLSAMISFWPHIVLHEAGHALAGIARGMRPIAFGIGRLRWDRGASGWRFRRGSRVAGVSGYAALLPEGERGLSRIDQTLYLLGGPLANLATAGLALALLYSPLGEVRLLAGILVGTAISGLLLGLANLVPFHSQGWRSDGRGLLDLLRHSPDATLQQRLQQVMALNMAGVRPRDWPQALLPPLPDGRSSSPMLVANGELLRLSWAMDRGDAALAADTALRVIAAYPSLPAAFQPHAAVSVAAYVARQGRDPALLAAWRPLCEGGITDLSPLRAWLDAEAAVLADPRHAAPAVAAARAGLDRIPDPTSRQLLGEYLDGLDARIDRAV